MQMGYPNQTANRNESYPDQKLSIFVIKYLFGSRRPDVMKEGG